MAVVTLAKQAREFGEFYIPRFEVHAEGTAVPEAIIRDITQVTYKDSIKEIDSFELTVGNWDSAARRFKYIGSETEKTLSPASPESLRYKLLEPCAREFELRMGYGSRLTVMTRGSVTTMEPNFPASGPPTLAVRALNVLHRLRDKQRSQHWTNKKDSQIAQSIKTLTDPATQKKLKIRVSKTAMSKEIPLDYVAQDNQYDIDFLFLRARNAGYVVFIDSEKKANGKIEEFLYFGPSDDKHPRLRDVTYELEWGISLIDFKPTLSTAKQVKSVEVRAWNRQTNKAIRETVDLKHPDIKTNSDLLELLTQPGCQPREEVVANEPQVTPQQARRRALAILSDRLKEMVTAQGTTVGLPDLRSGQRIRIKGVGSRFSGTYFVTETTHTIGDSGYTTRFTARREEPLPKGTKP
ncbi:phage late control D family protein [Bradyrhizobium liaoningense]|uniref:phage late control D family protein n=1 Tax=Bradyrhizobium liaoningense TaxID=43992 RepID=UPI001BADCF3B|nr:phage late control D family protein [Bradyrhizobium liaoningense]MBR0820219.1 phage late control D family protein [Bradyrhizobium liaoningense]